MISRMILVGLLAAAGLAVAPELKGSDYQPLAVGLTWEYSRTDSSGNEITMVRTITSAEKVAGNNAYVMETKTGTQRTRSWIVAANGSIRTIKVEAYGQQRAYKKPLLMIPAIPKKGATWKVKADVPQMGQFVPMTADFKIVGTQRITVKAGSFDCLYAKGTMTLETGEEKVKVILHRLFAAKVGLVKEVTEIPGQAKVELTLSKFGNDK